MFYLKVIFILLVVSWMLKAHAIKPSPVPTALQEESANSIVQYKGRCEYEHKVDNCMIGYDQATDTAWLLLFTDTGVLYKIVSKKGEDAPTTRWIHPALLV